MSYQKFFARFIDTAFLFADILALFLNLKAKMVVEIPSVCIGLAFEKVDLENRLLYCFRYGLVQMLLVWCSWELDIA